MQHLEILEAPCQTILFFFFFFREKAIERRTLNYTISTVKLIPAAEYYSGPSITVNCVTSGKLLAES